MGITLALLPPVGFLALLRLPPRQHLGQLLASRRGFICLGLVGLSLAAISSVLSSAVNTELLFTSLLLLLVPFVHRTSHATLFGLTCGVLMLVALFGLERAALARSWVGQTSMDLGRIGSVFLGSERVGSDGLWGAHNRYWSTRGASGNLRLVFDLRTVSGFPGNSWFSFGSDIVVEKLTGAEGTYNRISLPSPQSYVVQRHQLNEPVGGKTFRLRLRLRVDPRYPTLESSAETCSGIYLRVQPAGYEAACLHSPLANNWVDYEFTWSPPENSEATVIRAELRIPYPTFDVQSVRIEERTDEGWSDVGYLEPTGVHFSIAVDGKQSIDWPSYHLVPTPDWRRHSWAISPEDVSEALAVDTVRVALRVEADTLVELRNVRLQDEAGRNLRPVVHNERQELWYGHPNLAGHSLATLTIGLLAMVPSMPVFLLLSFTGGLGVFATGSRAAWLVLIVGTYLFAYNRWKAARLLLLFLAAAITVSYLLGLFSTESLGRLQIWETWDSGSISRFEIWGVAWNAFLDQPWTGYGSTGFVDAWKQVNAQATVYIPEHAHNIWLQHAVQSGIAGLLGIAWLTLGLTYLGCRHGGIRGACFMCSILILNVFDVSFHYQGVLFPMLFFAVTIANRDRRVHATA